MKRVVRRSGKEIYGPKWQNMAENEDDEDALLSASVETNELAETTATPLTETNGRNSKGQHVISFPGRCILKGDFVELFQYILYNWNLT